MTPVFVGMPGIVCQEIRRVKRLEDEVLMTSKKLVLLTLTPETTLTSSIKTPTAEFAFYFDASELISSGISFTTHCPSSYSKHD